MEEKKTLEFICGGCDKGCRITAEPKGGILENIRGNACGDGASFVQKEYLMDGE